MQKYSGCLLVIILSLIFSVPAAAADQFYYSGCSYYGKKNYDKAREMFLKSVEKSDFGESYYFLGEIEKLTENYKQADEYFKKAITKSLQRKYLRNSYWNLIVLAEDRSDYQAVVKYSKEMWDKIRDDGAKQKIENMINKYLWTDNKEAIEKYKLGINSKEKKSFEDAVKYFNEAISVDREFLAPRFELGTIYYRNGKNSEAISNLTTVAEKIPYYGEPNLILGDIYYGEKKYSRAISYLTKAADYGFYDSNTEYLILMKRGSSNIFEKRYDEAKSDFEKASSIKKKNIKPFISLGTLYIIQKEYDSAISAMQKANALKPQHRGVLLQLGSLYYRKDDEKFSIYFERLFDISKTKGHDQKYFRAYSILASRLYDKKRYERVVEIFEAVPEQSRGNDIKLAGAKANYRLGRYVESSSIFEKASVAAEDKVMFASACARSGNSSRAREILLQISSNEELMKKAKEDRSLKKIVDDMPSSGK